MPLDKYKVGEATFPTLVTIRDIQDVPYETPYTIVTYLHVPLQELTPDAIADILALPGVDAVEIRKEA